MSAKTHRVTYILLPHIWSSGWSLYRISDERGVSRSRCKLIAETMPAAIDEAIEATGSSESEWTIYWHTAVMDREEETTPRGPNIM